MRSSGAMKLASMSLALMLGNAAAAATDSADDAATAAKAAQYRAWVTEMKSAPRGPFGCAKHGDGYQHGEYSARTQQIRAAGYPIANLLTDVKPETVTGANADALLLPKLVLERFLVAYDDGWILRRAQFYRGAVQDHNEREGAQNLLLALSAAPGADYLTTREAARVMPHGEATPLMTRLRGMAITVDEKDPGFHALRSRIHNAPEAADALRVRDYAASPKAKPDLASDYEALAGVIDQAFKPQPLDQSLTALIALKPAPELLESLKKLAEPASTEPAAQLQNAAGALAWLRDAHAQWKMPATRLRALDTSLAAESAFAVAGSQLQGQIARTTRAQRLQWLSQAADAAYGVGLLSPRERASVTATIADFPDGKLELADYRARLEYLALASNWAMRRLGYHFDEAIARLQQIEPLATAYPADRVRSSPLVFYAAVLQTLREDADQLAGAQNKAFGADVGAQLRRLNPGIARGVLRTHTQASNEPAIYLVPSTVSDLPPSAGILTEQEGNPISHVQLLARNLGIPNVVVSGDLVDKLKARDGQKLVIAASPGGVVEIAEDSEKWAALLAKDAGTRRLRIVPDLGKLDLRTADFVSTDKLRASASGQIVGPKAANVGELTHRYPEYSAPGLAITFGVFRKMLDQPVKPGGEPMFTWMRDRYSELMIRRRLDPANHAARVSTFLAFVREWIAQRELTPELEEQLHTAMIERFGLDGTYGVFVRSDTNVEDLPGFTGAGLNKTLPNVVGFNNVVKAIKEVWASPFTERAFGWRQDLMDEPEQVFVSVLLHRSVPNDKSGVMITADVDTGDRDFLTVVASPGVGGGVDGEAAESLRVNTDKGKAQLLAAATTRQQRVLPLSGGARLAPASAPDALLQPDEIEQLIEVAKSLPKKYPELKDGEGEPTPADIEYGFLHGKLTLLQIRPFLQNDAARKHEYLAKLDQGLHRKDERKLDLRDVPETAP